MRKLQIEFLSSNGPQLERVIFTDLDGTTIITTRGTGRASSASGTFTWTAAVKGLAILILNTKTAEGVSAERGAISGSDGSLAASLDYAISKTPRWLIEIFGSDATGEPIARKLLRRTNPERKRPGPVLIAFGPHCISTNCITVLLDGEPLESRSDLSDLASLISKANNSVIRPRMRASAELKEAIAIDGRLRAIRERRNQLVGFGTLPAPFNSQEWLPRVRSALAADIGKCLRQMDIFSPQGLRHFVKSINHNTLYRKLCRKPFEPYHKLESLSDSLRLGVPLNASMMRADLTPQDGIHVHLPSGPYAAPLLFHFLKYVEGYHIETHAEYYCGTHLVADYLEGHLQPTPDAFVLGLDAAGFLLSSQASEEFVPFMVLPLSPHVILTPPKHDKDTLLTGDYILQADPHDCCKAYFRHCAGTGVINKRRIATHNIVPDQAFRILREGTEKVRLPTGLEFYRLVEPFCVLSKAEESREATEGSEVVLMLHRRMLVGRRALHFELAIRNAWLELAEDRGLLEQLIELMLLDHDFLRSVKRFAGLYAVPSAPSIGGPSSAKLSEDPAAR